MSEPIDRPPIRLRMAGPDDARFVWVVNNHPTVRSQAIHQADIPWDDHLVWYRHGLARPDWRFLIASEGDAPVAVARYEVEGDRAVITIAVDAACRGRGVGTSVIDSVTAHALAQAGVRRVVAYVRPGNAASQRAFLKNRYQQSGVEDVGGATVLRFERFRGEP